MRPWVLVLAVFVVALLGSLLALAPLEALFDLDSYYHLAVARLYGQAGIHVGLPWARFSAMRDGFGDKEFLFHVLLIPFATGDQGAQGGKLALALLNSGIAAALAALAVRFVGAPGALLPFVLFAVSLDSSGRLIRLRPELVSLLLLLAAAMAVHRYQDRMLAPLAALYALSHTGVQAVLVLAGAWFVADALLERRLSLGLLGWPALGAAIGLALHPHFPANLKVFWLQNVEHSRMTTELGGEFAPLIGRNAVLYNGGLWLALGLLLIATLRLPVPEGVGSARRPFAVAAACFALLYVTWLPRFALYLAPFASLAVLAELARRGPWPPLSKRGRWLLAGGALAVALCALPSLRELVRMLERERCFVGDREEKARAFSRLLPAGARVAAPWGATHWYVFWSPQARYLNVLDPVFMAVPFPTVYRLQQEVFHGREPDVPVAVAGALESDYLAFPRSRNDYPVRARLLDDPRVRMLHDGDDALYALVPGANRGFELDWRFQPGTAARAPRSPEEIAGWPRYTLVEEQRLQAFEGYVDATRMGIGEGCGRFARVEHVDRPLRVDWEFAPYGPGALWLDGSPLAAVRGATFAVVGEGVVLPVALSPGAHVITVDACSAEGRAGFYLLERGRVPGSP